MYCLIIRIIIIFSGDKERHKLPHDSKVIHAEFTYYYYPGDVAFPCNLNLNTIKFDVITNTCCL